MEIRNFGKDQDIRIGSQFPSVFNIRSVGGHDAYGVYAQTYICPDPKQRVPSENYAQLRRNKKNPMLVALFAVTYKETELPLWWADSEVLWDSRDEKADAAQKEKGNDDTEPFCP